MKKRKVWGISLMLFAAMILSISACSNPSFTEEKETMTSATTTEEIDPIEALNDKERRVYNALMEVIDDFYTPQSVRIMEMRIDESQYVHWISTSTEVVYLRISANNRVGGTLNYEYSLGLFSEEEFDDSIWHEVYASYDEWRDMDRVLCNGRDIYGVFYQITNWNEKVTFDDADEIVSHINQALEYYYGRRGL